MINEKPWGWYQTMDAGSSYKVKRIFVNPESRFSLQYHNHREEFWTELVGGVGKYGRLLGWLYVGDSQYSLNEQMITEGYAWEYDGGTKKKDFEELRAIRRSHGTLV